MSLRWSSFKFLQIIVFHKEFWVSWQSKKKNLKNFLLLNHQLDSIIILQECSLDRGLQNSFKKKINKKNDPPQKNGFYGRLIYYGIE